MPRTPAAELENALASGSFSAYFNAKIQRGAFETNAVPLSFKLGPLEMEISVAEVIPVSTSAAPTTTILERGVIINETTYKVSSSKYYAVTGVLTNYNDNVNYRSKGKFHLIPPIKVSFPGDVSYQTAIESFCTAINKTAIFKNPTAAYWDYQFLPAGRTYITNNAQRFLAQLKQKYLICACDNGNEEILFYAAHDYPVTPAAVLTVIPLYEEVGYVQTRYFIARDENNTVRTSGDSSNPIHNLGYLESTDDFPVSTFYGYDQAALGHTPPIGPNLTYQSGDHITLNDGELPIYPAEVIETFNQDQSPSWNIVIKQQEYISSTEGGALPSTIEQASPYTPLNTSNFDRFLTSAVNNLQAFADWVNDYALSQGMTDVIYAPIAKGVTNGDSHDHSGGDGAQINHVNLSSIGSNTHAQIDTQFATTLPATYAPIAKGVTGGDSHDHSGGDGAQIPTGGIADDAVTNAKAANMATATIKGRTTASTGDPEDLTVPQVQAMLGPIAETNTNDIYRCDSPGGVSAFVGTINGTPSGASVAYNVSSGQEAALKPTSTSQLGKLRIYNTTRGNSALISDCNTGTNTITLTTNAPANWANGDTITIASQTVSGGGISWIDIEITSGPTGKSAMFIAVLISSTTAGDILRIHPLETYSASKFTVCTAQVTSIGNANMGFVTIVGNVFSMSWSGSPSAVIVREIGYIP